jgi:tetratricopeptide (TPR) repeat protein
VTEALRLGADGVEIDVQLTADGVLVCAHDPIDPLPVAAQKSLATLAEVLAEVLALAAKLERALEVGIEALRSLDSSERTTARRARLHLALARAADGATKWALAGEHLEEARLLGRAAGDDVILARAEALAAHVAIGELRYHDAERLAQRALEGASRVTLPEATCEALEVLGRLERLRDLERAAHFFEQAYDLARRESLVLWSIRALHELGTIDMFQRTSPDRLLQASQLAYDAGALALAATVDLQLLGLYGFLFEIDRALEVGARVVDVAHTLGLAEDHAAALLQLGFVHGIAGRDQALEAAIDAALRVSGEHPEALALAWGHAPRDVLAADRGPEPGDRAVGHRHVLGPQGSRDLRHLSRALGASTGR